MTLSDDFFPFEFQRSEGGLFIDLNTFLAFGKDYVGWNYERTGNPVYLHIKQRKKLVPEDRPSKKPTLLAIGTFTTLINLILSVLNWPLFLCVWGTYPIFIAVFFLFTPNNAVGTLISCCSQ